MWTTCITVPEYTYIHQYEGYGLEISTSIHYICKIQIQEMLKHHSYLVWTKKIIKLLPFVKLQLAMVESLLMYLDVPYYVEISLWTTYLAFSMFESTCLSPFDLPKSFSYCHKDYLCRLHVLLYLSIPKTTNMVGMDL